MQYLSEELKLLEEEEKRDPVVTENTSEFILTLEYIEIVLPEDLILKRIQFKLEVIDRSMYLQ